MYQPQLLTSEIFLESAINLPSLNPGIWAYHSYSRLAFILINRIWGRGFPCQIYNAEFFNDRVCEATKSFQNVHCLLIPESNSNGAPLRLTSPDKAMHTEYHAHCIWMHFEAPMKIYANLVSIYICYSTLDKQMTFKVQPKFCLPQEAFSKFSL